MGSKISDSNRVQIRIAPSRRKQWQAEANKAAGLPDAPLGAWVRMMVERARALTVSAAGVEYPTDKAAKRRTVAK